MSTFKTPLSLLSIVGLSFVLFSLGSCEEEPPFIDLTDGSKPLRDTTYITASIPAAQEKNVLLEDISGVNCVNCPDAAVKAEAILADKGARVTVVTLIPDKSLLPEFTDPKNIFTDLTNKKVNQLLDFVGPPGGLPAGMINRISDNGIIKPWQAWDGPVDNELNKPNTINIELDNTYEASTNEVIVTVKVTFVDDQVDTTQNISILLTETDIVGIQKDRSGVNSNYTFKHIMRDFATSALGDPIKAKLEKGRVVERQYRIKLDPSWIAANCEVVALVHSRTNKDVYQSVHKKLK